jgi:hypothetical protein
MAATMVCISPSVHAILMAIEPQALADGEVEREIPRRAHGLAISALVRGCV